MGAWPQTKSWNLASYLAYRAYVGANAPQKKGLTQDCTDLSLLLLIEFASQQGLVVTFRDNASTLYISKAEEWTPVSHHFSKPVGWKTMQEYYRVVQARIGARSMLQYNVVRNPYGPEVGDLMINNDASHTALVLAIYPSGQKHPKEEWSTIPDFPGEGTAEKQLDQLEYFRTPRQVDTSSHTPKFPASALATAHFDYLNHRGNGKEKAEIIYFADVGELRAMGFEFYLFNKYVLDDWNFPPWDGKGRPPAR